MISKSKKNTKRPETQKRHPVKKLSKEQLSQITGGMRMDKYHCTDGGDSGINGCTGNTGTATTN